MTALSTLSDIATKDFQQESQQRRRTCRDTDYPYEWTEDDEAEPTNSSSYANSSHQGSPQMVNYRSDYPSPSSRHSAGFPSATSSAYSFEDEKVMGSLEDRFPFLKEERKRTRKLLTAEQTRVLEAILEKTVYPSTPLREAVARQLGIPPRKVQIWFQNKRQGRRRAPSAESSSTATASQANRKQRSSDHLRHHTMNQPSSSMKDHPRRVTVGAYNDCRPSPQPPLSAPIQGSSSSLHRRMHSGSLSSSSRQHSFQEESVPREDDNVSVPAISDFLGSRRAAPSQLLALPPHTSSVSRPAWGRSSSCVRNRPSPLYFENGSARSSTDSLASSANSIRGDDWTMRVASLSSSSSKTAFSEGSPTQSETTLDASLSKHMLSLHQITAAYFASTRGEKLQLAPIDSDASKRNGSLPSISELILD